MPSTFSPALRLELIGNGEQAANWGNTTNTNLGTLLEQAIAGVESIAMSDANYTLVSGNGISDEARNAVIIMTGTLTATRNVVVPTSEKFYAVRNATTNGQSIIVKTSAGTGVTLANGFTQLMYCDGTNVVLASVAVKSSDGSIAGPFIITADSSSAALRITQTGSGNALLVEDSANPDATPFVVDASGNVGVGTSSPSDKFQVNIQDGVRLGASGVVSYARIGSATGGEGTAQIGYDRSAGATTFSQGNTGSALTESMRIDSSGNVGIGTSSPSQKLTVVDATSANFLLSGSTTSYITYAYSGFAVSGTTSNTPWLFYTNNTERMRIDSSGNVGIGNSSPTSKLSVSSASSVQMQATTGTVDFRIQSIDANAAAYSGTVSNHAYAFTTNNVERMRIDASGNVGIGTGSPTSKLDVNGVIKSQGATVDAFPSGTVLVFAQTAAPTGWTKSTTHNDKALRVVSGSASSGGSVAFTTAFASQAVSGTVGDTTLNSSQIPSHTHTGSTSTASLTGGFGPFRQTLNSPDASASGVFSLGAEFGSGDANAGSRNTRSINMDASHAHSFTTDATGGGGSHTHSFTGTAINLAVQYVDVILATKN